CKFYKNRCKWRKTHIIIQWHYNNLHKCFCLYRCAGTATKIFQAWEKASIIKQNKSSDLSIMTWTEANKWECEWHGDCANSYNEETKQFIYAKLMGLDTYATNY